MAENKNNGLLWVAVAVGGYMLYRWYESRQGMVGPGIPGTVSPSSTLVNPTNVPTSGTIAPPPATATTGPLPQAITTQNALTAGIDPVEYGVVQKWAQADGRPPVLAFAAANVGSEYDGMYNLITNFWDKGIQPSSSPAYQPEVDFWDNLRKKYDPTHIYW